MKRTILVISFSDLSRDPRVRRQIEALRQRYRVIAAGTGDPGYEGVQYVHCGRAPRTFTAKAMEGAQLLARRYERFYWAQRHIADAITGMSAIEADLVIANDIEALPVAGRVARGAKVILDAHEYAPREMEDKLAWRVFRQRYIEYLCGRYIPTVSGMMTVAEGIAAEYRKHYGVNAEVIRNTPGYEALQPSPVDGEVRMIHHGAAIPARRIEGMLETMRHLDQRFKLDLMLLPTVPRYLEGLKRRAGGDARIRFLPPVPTDQLVRFSNRYDVGLYLLQPSSFNNRYALPNKLFEFIQSRLMVAIGPSTEMADLVKRYQCGVVAEDFRPASLARALSKLTPDAVEKFKQNSDRAARELCFDRVSEKLLAVVASALGER